MKHARYIFQFKISLAMLFLLEGVVVSGVLPQYAFPESSKVFSQLVGSEDQPANSVPFDQSANPSTSLPGDDTLSEAEERNRKFQELIIKADPQKGKILSFYVQMALARFGYDPGPFSFDLTEKTRSAIREYQRYNQLKVTGDLEMELFEQIGNDVETLDATPNPLPGFLFFGDLWDSYVSVQGTWEIEHAKQAAPTQTTTIDCHREWQHCIETTAVIGFGGSRQDLSQDVTYYEVERWDEFEITTKPHNKVCVRYTIRIDRFQKSVTGLRLKTRRDGYCAALQDSMKLRLVDGLEVWHALRKQHQEARRRIMRFPWASLKELKE